MRGAAARELKAIEHNVQLAWWIENLNGAGAKLKPLKHYLDMLKPKRAQSAADILHVFREYQRRGAPIKITRIPANGAD